MTNIDVIEFRQMCDVALRVNPGSDDIATAPEHDFFVDDAGDVQKIRCPALSCTAVYAIGYSKVYRTKRSFSELRDHLLVKLKDDHTLKRKHRAAIALV